MAEQLALPLRRPPGRPISSSHPRAAYWREYKRRKKAGAPPPGPGWSPPPHEQIVVGEPMRERVVKLGAAWVAMVVDYRTLPAAEFLAKYPHWRSDAALRQALLEETRDLAPSSIGGTDG